VQDGVSGYLTPVGDTDAMASKALSLLTDLDQLRTFKEAAYHRAKTFDINHVVPMYLDIYERALACVAR
jgi:glycosyltransferase involved in cell wall biosynthesis